MKEDLKDIYENQVELRDFLRNIIKPSNKVVDAEADDIDKLKI